MRAWLTLGLNSTGMTEKEPICIHGRLTKDFEVIPDDGFEGEEMQDGPYHGKCAFHYLPPRGTEPAYVCVVEAGEAGQEVAAAVNWNPWIPGITISFGRVPSDLTLDGLAEAYYLVDTEPPFYDPAFGSYYPVYEAGAAYHLRLEFTTTDGPIVLFDDDVHAGDEFDFALTPVSAGDLTCVGTFSFGGTVLHTATYVFDISGVTITYGP